VLRWLCHCLPRGILVGPTCQVSVVVGPTWLRWTNRRVSCGTQIWGGFSVCCHLAPLLAAVDHSQAAKWRLCWCGLWCGPIRVCHVSLRDLTVLKSILPRGMGWVRWTNEVLPRGISGIHLSDMRDPHGWGGPMRRWHVALTCWGGPMRCWHVAPSLSSLILCVYVWDPQFAPSSVSIPKLHPDKSLIESQPLICLFNLFYLLWIYFNSSTYPKIMKFSPKIPKFMMITLIIFNFTFAPASLH
jgi:hypothetical protein